MSFDELLECLAAKDVKLWNEDGRLRYSAPEGGVTPELRAELAQHKQRLMEHLRHSAGASPALPLPPPVTEKAHQPSCTQRQLWFHHQLYSSSSAYHMQHNFLLKGRLHVEVLEQCLKRLIERHEALRTVFRADGGRPVAVVKPEMAVALNRVKLPGDLGQTLAREAALSFNLTDGPLFRFTLFQVQEDHHVLSMTLHHIIADGWSMGVIFKEVSALYAAFLEGKPDPLPPLRVQYADFAEWQHQWLQGDAMAKERDYWRSQLDGAPSLLNLPADHPRPEVATFRGSNQTRDLPPRLSDALKELSHREGTTLFITLLAAFKALLARYTSQEDLVVGAPFACRSQTRWEGLVGFFANSVVLRSDLSGSPSFKELLARVRQGVLGALAHQDFPFELLVETLQPNRTASYNPIFQVMFDIVDDASQTLVLPGVTVEHLPVVEYESKFDLNLTVHLRPEGLQAVATYSADLFDDSTMARLLEHFEIFLEGITGDPHQSISVLPLLSASEQDQLLHKWNRTDRKFSLPKNLQELFEQQARRAPEAVAIEQGSSRLTYGELDRQAGQLAQSLRRLGVKSGMRIGLCLERSVDLIRGVLAVLKTGAAYVPLNPAFPHEQLAFMIDNIQSPLLLTQQSLLPALSGLPVPKVCLDAMPASPEAILDPESMPGGHSGAIAYVIYTSGSTGRPKGVLISHRAVMNYAAAANEHYRIGAGDRVLQFAPINFDASVEEIFCSLSFGATLVLRDEAMLDAMKVFLDRCRQWRITVLSLPTAFWHELVQAMAVDHLALPSSLRLVIIGGERALPDRLALWQRLCPPSVQLINSYGPTEATVVATVWTAGPSAPPAGEVPIGRPLANVQAFVLDTRGQLTPRGVVGELCLGGASLAEGYFNQPELTREKFIPHPFRPATGERIYRTGDLVRWLPDGNLVYCGRVDNQVKIRGFRIELGEVESVLQRHPEVRDAVVVVCDDPPRGKSLAAYVVPKQPGALELSRLRAYAKEKLPPYMLPAAFVVLDQMPLTRNGKVDRKALPAPATQEGYGQDQDDFVPPRDTLEIQLAKLWQEVLGVRAVSVRDNFFDLGGHSLLAVRLFAELDRLIGRQLPLATLFQAPTVERLAQVLRDAQWNPPWSPLVPIKASGSRPPFYCVHGAGGNIVEFLHLSRYMADNQPLYGIQAQGLDGKAPWLERVEDMAALYIKEILAFQPQGPYYLGGSSFGGMIAYEMAQQLRAQGQAVALLALFDTNGPGYPQYLPGFGRGRRWLFRQRERFELHWSNWRLLEAGEARREFVQDKWERICRYLWKKQNRMRRIWRELQTHWSLPQALRQVNKSGRQASQKYAPQPYDGRITLFRASHQGYGIVHDRTLGWGSLAKGGLEIIDVPGYHGSIIREPRVRVLAEKLNQALQQPPKQEACHEELYLVNASLATTGK